VKTRGKFPGYSPVGVSHFPGKLPGHLEATMAGFPSLFLAAAAAAAKSSAPSWEPIVLALFVIGMSLAGIKLWIDVGQGDRPRRVRRRRNGP
jgi:hypothetical protein